MESVGSPALWGAFIIIVGSVLAMDLGLFNRKAREMTQGQALAWTCAWFALSMAFNAFVYWKFGATRAAEFFQAYVVEETLSVDNVFVFLVILRFFNVPAFLKHRVLFWGILGAIVARGVFIFVGAAVISHFHSIMYLFGAVLLFTAWKLLFQDEEEQVNMEKNIVVRLFQRFVPMVTDYRGTAMTVVENGRRYATPLLCVMTVLPATDIVFAVDSIPAVFGVTRDVFIVYTSNICAVMGLRSLTFLVEGVLDRFHYVKYGLALVLAFIGTKILIASLYEIPAMSSLGVVALLLAGSATLSLVFPKPLPATAPVPASNEDRPER